MIRATGTFVNNEPVIDGDRVRITGVRNFDYRSETDFVERWEEREVSLAHLTSVDLFISSWKAGPIGHTFVSFNFDDAPPVCISIETRPEEGEGFAPVASLFKQFELIYVVGEERDLVGRRLLLPLGGHEGLFFLFEDADQAAVVRLARLAGFARSGPLAEGFGRLEVLRRGLIVIELEHRGELDATTLEAAAESALRSRSAERRLSIEQLRCSRERGE